MTMTTTRRRSAHLAIAIAVVAGAGAACTPAPRGDDNSHLSRYSNAVYASEIRNTRVVVAIGWNDPATGPAEKVVDVNATQSWCDGSTLVSRTLSGTAADYLGAANPAEAYSVGLTGITLQGTQTSTPAGAACATPDAGAATTSPVSFDAFVISDVRGSGERISYTEDDGGEFTYQEATASGALILPELDGWFGFEREASEPGATWLWEGFWADARGIDVSAAVPAT